jgi:hypothetical protein
MMRHGHGADRAKEEWEQQKQEPLRPIDIQSDKMKSNPEI